MAGMPAVALIASPALAVDRFSFDVPAGSLQAAVVAIGSQAGITIGLTDARLGAIRVPGVKGRMPVSAALERLLRGSEAGFVAIDAATFQIVRRRMAAPPPAPPPQSVPDVDTDAAGAIIVTGSKRAVPLADYPASVDIVDIGTVRPGRALSGSDALVEQTGVLASTHFGPGRDKLFVRGIADSSFSGPTQATVGQYLGEVRLNYNAPDPDLALYDVSRVEVLEGPQGTLYGASSLGGIIRLVPNPPDLANRSLIVSAGGALTAHGAPDADGAAIFNLPLVRDRVGLRLVGYGGVQGGYIDDPLRHLGNINRTLIRGGRATLRIAAGNGWTIDLGGVAQNIDSRDGQYSEGGLPPLERASVIAQPFDNDYSLASAVVHHQAGATTFVSATSYVDHDVNSTYDASPSPATPMRYVGDDKISLIVNETRLAHTSRNGRGWVVGVELLHSDDIASRSLGPAASPAPINGTRNTVEEGSFYGEASIPLWRRWSITGGGRMTYARFIGRVIDQPGGGDESRRHDLALLPSLALLWKPAPRLSVYARYQEGYRPGGLSVQATTSQRFNADSVATWELGARYGGPADRFSAAAGASYAHWENIQADLVDISGLPYTANIGSGRILGLEVRGRWRPAAGLALDGSLFADSSRLSRPVPAFAGESDASLPNIPDLIARAGLRYDARIGGRRVSFAASARYVGGSRLGVGTTFDLHQGHYLDTSAGMSVPLGRATLSLDATNLLDVRGNMFALGNPFGVTRDLQRTRLRPRTIRLGMAMRF